MSGVEEVGGAVLLGAAVVVVAGYYWVTQGAPAAEKFVREVGKRVDEVFADDPPTATQPCPLPPGTPEEEKPKEDLPPGGAPEPEPKPPPYFPPIPSGKPATTYKPIISGQEYSDQTCDNARLQQLRDQLSRNKKAVGGSGLPFKPAKRPYDEADPAQAAKKKLLCDNLREREQAWEDLIRTRDQNQDECFDSPKKTPDEIKRDNDHKEARSQAERALANVRKDIAFYGCP